MDADSITYTLDAASDSQGLRLLRQALDHHNVNAGGPYDQKPLTVFASERPGVLLGGLRGLTFWRWLFIDVLWVHEALRGRGIGRRLVAEAEAEAVRRGCIGAFVDTLTFQAPTFYPKCGYREFGRIDDFPPGHARIWFQKSLA